MAERRVIEDALFENARIFSTNWDGNKFGHGGKPTFCIALEPETADALERDGWKVRRKLARNDEEEDLNFLPVSINFEFYQEPNIYLVVDDVRTRLTKETLVTLGNFRSSQFGKIDIFVHPSVRVDQFTGEEKVTAYVKTMYVFVEANDPLEDEYRERFGEPSELPFE